MSTFGHVFRVTTFVSSQLPSIHADARSRAGESHCRSVTVIVDNCPPGLRLSEEDIQPQLTRRRPGQSAISTPRNESDQVEIQSGTEFGITLGTPIAMRIPNNDQRPHDYKGGVDLFPRPSHADFTYLEKYGVKASSGGGRSSARETIARVAAGAIAEKVLRESYGIEIVAFVTSVGNEFLFPPALPDHPTATTQPGFLKLIDGITRQQVDGFHPTRCPNADVNARMVQLIERVKDAKDSIGGVVTCVVRNLPAGLGEPCFDKLEAVLAHAMMSIPATVIFPEQELRGS